MLPRLAPRVPNAGNNLTVPFGLATLNLPFLEIVGRNHLSHHHGFLGTNGKRRAIALLSSRGSVQLFGAAAHHLSGQRFGRPRLRFVVSAFLRDHLAKVLIDGRAINPSPLW